MLDTCLAGGLSPTLQSGFAQCLVPLQREQYHPIADKHYERVASINSGQTLVVLRPKAASLALK